MHASTEQMGIKAANHIAALLAYWDKDEICRFANAAYLEWYGKSQEELIDKMSMEELLGPGYAEHVPFIREALKGNKQSFNLEIRTPDGEWGHSHVTVDSDDVDHRSGYPDHSP